MIKSALTSAFALLSLMAGHAAAEGRVSTLEYRDFAVVRLEACVNFQTTITFAPDELVENVSLGDGTNWQVVPNRRGDLLFIKPTAEKAFSNMTVVTDRRRYNFELRHAPRAACQRGEVIYDLRFTYPGETLDELQKLAPPDGLDGLPLPEKRNTAYTFTGDPTLIPMRVFDDGVSTYFLWPEGVMNPAVYAVTGNNTEALVNYSHRGEYFVVDVVARAFTLRQGEQMSILYNDSFAVPTLDALSPQPRPEPATKPKKRSSWFGGSKDKKVIQP